MGFDPDCSGLHSSCVASKAVVTVMKAVTDEDTVDAIKVLVRGAAQSVIDITNDVFKIKAANFNMVLDPDDKSGSMELNLEATVFGAIVGPHKISVDSNDIAGFVDKVIQQFAPVIYALKTRRV